MSVLGRGQTYDNIKKPIFGFILFAEIEETYRDNFGFKYKTDHTIKFYRIYDSLTNLKKGINGIERIYGKLMYFNISTLVNRFNQTSNNEIVNWYREKWTNES